MNRKADHEPISGLWPSKGKNLFQKQILIKTIHSYYSKIIELIATILKNFKSSFVNGKSKSDLVWAEYLKTKTSCDQKWLPQIHLIGCWGVKLLLTKDFCQKVFFWLEFDFLIFSSSLFELLNFFSLTIWVVKFCHSLSFWNLSNFELNFVPIQVFGFCYNSCFEFCYNIIFFLFCYSLSCSVFFLSQF